mmetsp:Transcript_22781/g.29506  ORF Transcript_22781/g.29506 Transcript_22781/m.29506 type:complete len:97 (+) Transcript_22781:727-1017(+)|eukprot:CAMPEP_0197321258 /NCGR_PEP_ID=MMETSP0891-20130614/64116_1 /TAXON_ID=44058 ORGANISM="Aureoumbra lagunensis, Strain CCMP1510" /NCGR_SAMPLE_ID=MMETSP0891 /ASSEMBLY_ACC=CAM_ASM_000534 /LENGTH=96 /DNA_ID=CAMNT_0042813045 /DNA_START=673 /DNA_END=963 /DNA_ORIENTATION=+
MTSVDCYNTSRLIEQLINRFDLPTSNGFPILNDNLQWDQPDFSVVGALAALGVGPDAANLMGISRAAEVVSESFHDHDQHGEFSYQRGQGLRSILM